MKTRLFKTLFLLVSSLFAIAGTAGHGYPPPGCMESYDSLHELMDTLMEEIRDVERTNYSIGYLQDKIAEFSLCADSYIERGMDKNIKDKELQLTPTMKAAMYGFDEILKSLIIHGANIWAVDEDGNNALDYMTSLTQDKEFQQLFPRYLSLKTHEKCLKLLRSAAQK